MRQKNKLLLIFIFILYLAASAFSEVLQEITVKEGDTLWSVANYYLKDPQRWPEILKYNSLPSSDYNVILPGMKLKVPIILIKENLRAAHLMYALNDVRYRRRSQAEWQKAWIDMELYNEDGLRTLQQSKAKVKFSSGETLAMDENSLIILKPEQKQEEINLLSGAVRTSKTKVLANSSVIAPRIEPKGIAPDFKTKLKEDKTTLVEVYEGIVDVTAQGKTVTLTKGFGTEVKFKQAPSSPRLLPPSPEMSVAAPANIPEPSQKVLTDSLELNIKQPFLSSQNKNKTSAQIISQAINKYHLQISTSINFVNVLIDEINPISGKVTINFKKTNLGDGIYYYHLSYVDDLGFEGQFSSPTQFIIDTTAPSLEILSPKNEEEFDTEFVHVSGKTEPGSMIKVNFQAATVEENGDFIIAVMPKNGWNLIKIIAQDAAGNITKKELTINKVKVIKKDKKEPEKNKSSKPSMTFASFVLGTLTTIVIIGVLVLLAH